MTKHVVVWIDHKEAHVFHIDAETVAKSTVLAPLELVHHKHPKGPEGAKDHPNDAKQFFEEVARSLQGTVGVLVVGPATAKLEFIKHLHKHDTAVESRIVGVETVDHPTDGQLVAYAKKYFIDGGRTPR